MLLKMPVDREFTRLCFAVGERPRTNKQRGSHRLGVTSDNSRNGMSYTQFSRRHHTRGPHGSSGPRARVCGDRGWRRDPRRGRWNGVCNVTNLLTAGAGLQLRFAPSRFSDPSPLPGSLSTSMCFPSASARGYSNCWAGVQGSCSCTHSIR